MAKPVEPEDGRYRVDALQLLHGHRVTAEPMQGVWIGWTRDAALEAAGELIAQGWLRVKVVFVGRRKVEGNCRAEPIDD